jgi:ribosomal protein S27E
MIKISYQDILYRGTMKWIKRGKERFLHVRCTMDYDAKGTIENLGHIVVDCGNCGKQLAISNGNSSKIFFHKCRKEGT